MALSKLVIGLIAGIGSVVAIGGITAGVVVSRNNTVVEATNENNESNSKDTNRANKTPNKDESLMANQPKSDARNNDKALMDQTEITQPDQDNKSDSGATTTQIANPVSASGDGDSSTRGMKEQEEEAKPEVQQNHQAGTDTQVQGSSADEPATSTYGTGQSAPTNAQGTGDNSAAAEARSVSVAQEG